MSTQANSQIFTNSVFGTGTDHTSAQLTQKDIETQETYLASSSYSNMSTRLPRVPSNQKVAKGS